VAFSARRTLPVEYLALEVRDVGTLQFPVPHAQARKLCAVARPARYGRGEQTLLDQRVRDTWEIPLSRVKIDKRRWHSALRPMLDRLRGDLGLPEGCALTADLHSMLVYGPGQFFVPHQDSEKDDTMVGSLVVTMPSSFTGGDLVVEHGNVTKSYRGSKTSLSLVAFYADCRHQIHRVRSGYRIVLTYNLLLRGGPTAAGEAEVDRGTADTIAAGVEKHFATPVSPRWRGDSSAGEPPARLVYLLDHEYTQRGLSWSRLKGSDASRAAMLREVAERTDCDIVLALADVHEIWSCYGPDDDYDPRWGRRRRGWEGDSYGEYGDEPAGDPGRFDDFQVHDLIDSMVTLDSWVGPEGGPAAPVASTVGHEEICASTPSSALKPYASEYEGYMGNYGNTLDRWYHRGALVLWPRQRAFAVRAEASPGLALDELSALLRAGDRHEVRDRVTTLGSVWSDVVDGNPGAAFVSQTLHVAGAARDGAVATVLLAPLHLTALEPVHAPAIVGLHDAYGPDWLRKQIDVWTSATGKRARGLDRLSWIGSLARLSEALVTAGPSGQPLAAQLARHSWSALQPQAEHRRHLESPSHRAEALGDLAQPFLALVEAAVLAGDTDLRDHVVAFLCEGGTLLPLTMALLRGAAAAPLEPDARTAAGLDEVAGFVADRLRARLAEPPRAAGDWSIEPPAGCDCELCRTLAEFLADPTRHAHEWRIAKEKRQHVHRRIDVAGLPVRHQTRRQGSPHTLVLTKTKDLFQQEEQARRQARADLDWLADAGLVG
jgi:hypothetical protein